MLCSMSSIKAIASIVAWDGRGDRGWRQERVGHELSTPIDGRGHNRGRKPRSKVSMMTIHPPQQGQECRSASACAPFGSIALTARRCCGHAEELTGQCDAGLCLVVLETAQILRRRSVGRA